MTTGFQAARKVSDYWPQAKIENINYFVGAYQPGLSIQKGKITSDDTTYDVVFSALGLSDMHDDDYTVALDGEGGDERVSARSSTGFTIAGIANTEVVRFTVTGRLKGQAG